VPATDENMGDAVAEEEDRKGDALETAGAATPLT
jgi:hypothetical protein